MKDNKGKLIYFSQDIMADIEEERKDMLHKVEKELEEDYLKKELAYLNNAYEFIQEELERIDQEKEQIISKTIMDNRMKLLEKRNEYIQRMYTKAREGLQEYTKKETYLPYLLKLIKIGRDVLGEGKLVVYINSTDKEIAEKLAKSSGVEIIVESREVDLIGGCRVYNIDRKMVMDASFMRKLEEQRETFIHRCHLEIE